MQYGEKQTTTNDGDTEKKTTQKLRHGLPFLNETVFKEQVQIMQPSDLDSIIQTMHIQHGLDNEYGAWIKKANNGRLYVIKYWVEREATTK